MTTGMDRVISCGLVDNLDIRWVSEVYFCICFHPCARNTWKLEKWVRFIRKRRARKIRCGFCFQETENMVRYKDWMKSLIIKMCTKFRETWKINIKWTDSIKSLMASSRDSWVSAETIKSQCWWSTEWAESVAAKWVEVCIPESLQLSSDGGAMILLTDKN